MASKFGFVQPGCRQREWEARAALLLAQQNRAGTIRAAELDAQINSAEAALNPIDKKKAVKEADPQSASMAKAIGSDQNMVAVLSQAFVAISIEFGSGVGFWRVFGHAAPARRQNPLSTKLVAVDPSHRCGAILQVGPKGRRLLGARFGRGCRPSAAWLGRQQGLRVLPFVRGPERSERGNCNNGPHDRQVED